MDISDIFEAIPREFRAFFEFSNWPIPGTHREAAQIHLSGNARVVLFGFADLFLAAYIYRLATTGQYDVSLNATAYPFVAAVIAWLLWLAAFALKPGHDPPSQSMVFAAVIYGLAPAALWCALGSALAFGVSLLLLGSERAFYGAQLVMMLAIFPFSVYGSYLAFRRIGYTTVRGSLVSIVVATTLLVFSVVYVMLATGTARAS